jgi:hypothetical protein
MAMVTGEHQQGVAPGIRQIDRQPVPKHFRKRCGFAGARQFQSHDLKFGISLFFCRRDFRLHPRFP